MRSTSIWLVSLMLAGCQGTSGRLWAPVRMTPEAEALAGARAAPSVEARYGGVVRDADAERRMERIGQQLSRGTPAIQGRYQYRLLNCDRINAFSLPGGRIYLCRSLYARLATDDLLAAVLAHETAHIAARDHFKPRCGTVNQALDREMSADVRGMAYLRAAGLAPQAMIGVVGIIRDAQPRGWSDTRAASIARSLDQANLPSQYAQRCP